MRNRLILTITLGLILRIILMPFSIHPDLRGHYLGAYFIAIKGDLLGVYDHISRLPRADPMVLLYHDNFLVYPPLTYLVHAAWLKISYPLINWSLFNLLEIDIGQAVQQPGIPWLIFVLKTPYLIADTAFLLFLLQLFESRHRLQIAVLWSLNLPLIYSAFLMGQFDVFLVLFITIALFWVKRHRLTWAAISLGLAAGFKPFSLFLLPFLPGNLSKNLSVGLATYFLVILPYLPSPGYRMYALIAGHSEKMWFAKLLVSGSQYLPLFIVGFVGLFWYKVYFPQSLPDWTWLMTPLLLFFSVTHFHPQWFSWLSPFLVLSFIFLPKTKPLLIYMLIAFIAVVFSFEPSLNFGLFGINFSLADLINHYYSLDQLMSFVRGALAATSLAFIILVPKVSHSS